jgi:hypothetical protein
VNGFAASRSKREAPTLAQQRVSVVITSLNRLGKAPRQELKLNEDSLIDKIDIVIYIHNFVAKGGTYGRFD